MIEKAVKTYENKTANEIISMSPAEFVERHEQKDLYDLFDDENQLIDDEYDFKKFRGNGIA